MWDKKGENITYRFYKSLKEQLAANTDSTTDKVAGINNALEQAKIILKKMSNEPASGKEAVKLAQTVVGDIIYGEGALPYKQKKIKPDGKIGPVTLQAFVAVGIPATLIGENPRDRKNFILALRNINKIRQVLSQKYDAAISYTGVNQAKAIEAAKSTNPNVEPVKIEEPKSLVTVVRPARSSTSESSEIVEVPTAFGGKAKLDKTLWELILQMRKDAIADGVMSEGDKFFLPAGGASGLRSLESQKQKWESRYGKDLDALKTKGIVRKGKNKIMKKEGDKFVFYVNGKPQQTYSKIEDAATKIARQEVSFPGKSKHSSGRTIDFWLGIPLKIENKSAVKASKIGKWLFEKGPTIYGLWNYPTEFWHWELSDNNQQFWASAFNKGQTPNQIAAAMTQKTTA